MIVTSCVANVAGKHVMFDLCFQACITKLLFASIDQPFSMYVNESQVSSMPFVVEFCLMVASVVALASK